MLESVLNGQTPDIVAENIQKLKSLFPEIVTEDKIDFEKLQAVLGKYIDNDNERYNFAWHGKSKALRLAQTPSTGTLRPCKEESKDWDTTQNLYIEGDNLEVLKLLQKAYHNKIKMIYIDPPYNTGNDFVYPDDYKDNLDNYLSLTGQKDEDGGRISTNSETNGRYHTNWLNMMYPRLRLARNILADDGIIAISIDDNEFINLQKICDEIFGEENFIGNIIVKSNPRGSQSIEFLASQHEYLLVYAKNISNVGIVGHSLTDEMIEEYKYEDSKGKYRLLGLRQRGGFWRRKDRPFLYYPIFVNEDGCISIIKKDGFNIEVVPFQPSSGEDGTWRWSKEKLIKNQEQIIAKQINRDGNEEWDIFQKDYLYKDGSEIRRTKVKSLWDEKEMNYQNGSTEIKELFQNNNYFDFPKPVDLLKKVITMMNYYEEDIILDFFSGAATTAHAVMQLNAEDKGNRKFIMVQLPEPCGKDTEAYKAGYKNICEIGKERIRRAGEKIIENLECRMQNDKEKGKARQLSLTEDNSQFSILNSTLPIPDIGFKVFKLDSSNLKKWNPDYDNLETSLEEMISNYVDGRTELDVVYEIMLKYGIDLTLPVEECRIENVECRIYSIGMGALIICLSDNLSTDVAQEIIKLKQRLNPETMRVVFKDNGFKDDATKTNVKENLKQAGIEEFVTV